MDKPKYKKEYNMKLVTVFLYMILLYFLMGIITLFFNKIWSIDNYPINRWLFLPLLVVCTFIHELIHGIFAAIYSPNRFKNIKFGFKLKSLIAYCSINEDMQVKYSKVVIIMPFIVLSLVPFIICFIYGLKSILNIAIIHAAASIGDLIMFIWLCNEENDYWVKNEKINPKKLEMIVFEE
ncbi:MAG: DUF3267 domain-containing protein [Prevotellaceae bacterium]|jgi:hypothetical protein|nr:DUF3267 domain-containing protein [Prevotellaceae bacterium]